KPRISRGGLSARLDLAARVASPAVRRDGNLWASIENRNYLAMRFRKGLVKHIRQVFRGPNCGPLAAMMLYDYGTARPPLRSVPRGHVLPMATYDREGLPRSALRCSSRPPSEKAPNPTD